MVKFVFPIAPTTALPRCFSVNIRVFPSLLIPRHPTLLLVLFGLPCRRLRCCSLFFHCRFHAILDRQCHVVVVSLIIDDHFFDFFITVGVVDFVVVVIGVVPNLR